MRRTLLITLIFFSIIKLAYSQDFPNGEITSEELDMKKYAKDTAAHAVVLNEFGSAKIAVVAGEDIRLVFEYHVKIKIIDNDGMDNGTIQLPVFHDSDNPDSYENIEDIKGNTYYKDENGTTQTVPLEADKVYIAKDTKHISNYKFVMPGMRKGCIIEYKYKFISPYFETFHPWSFQGYIPKINSEYEVHIPAYYRYNVSLIGFLKLSKNTSVIEHHCFATSGGNGYQDGDVDCSLINFGMRDIPAFIKEDYMTSEKNYLSSIKFELAEYSNPYTNIKGNWTKDWKDVDIVLKKDFYFGDQLKKKALFKDRIVPVIAGKDDNLSKAKAIYLYIQKSFKWTNVTGFESDKGLGAALDKHEGNVGEINLSLITALNAAGLNAEAVLLSTRNHGTVGSLYPVVNDFNYVIAKVDIDGQSYLLDATDPLLSFGMLPLRCLNGKGRVFNADKPSYFIDINPPQKEKGTKTLDLTLGENGKLTGSVIYYNTSYEAYEKRTAIKKFNSIDEYVDDLNGKWLKVKITKSDISNLDSLDKPLIEKYDVEINLTDKLNNHGLAFNPFFWERVQTNPFNLAERNYPVDFGMPYDERQTLVIHLPADYMVEAPPQVVGLGLPETGGKFLTNYEPGDNSFTFSQVIQLNKSSYDPGEYPYLKEFYNKIIQSENSEIIFRKK